MLVLVMLLSAMLLVLHALGGVLALWQTYFIQHTIVNQKNTIETDIGTEREHKVRGREEREGQIFDMEFEKGQGEMKMKDKLRETRFWK